MIQLREIYKMELERIGNATIVTNIRQIPVTNNMQHNNSSNQSNLQNQKVIQQYQKILAKGNQSREW